MSVDSDVEIVVDATRESETYANAVGIFSGKAHKAPSLEEKRTMLLNIVKRPPEEPADSIAPFVHVTAGASSRSRTGRRSPPGR